MSVESTTLRVGDVVTVSAPDSSDTLTCVVVQLYGSLQFPLVAELRTHTGLSMEVSVYRPTKIGRGPDCKPFVRDGKNTYTGFHRRYRQAWEALTTSERARVFNALHFDP